MKKDKYGSAKMALLISVAVVSIAGLLIAGVVDDKSVNGGTYTLSESGGSMTLTVNTVAANVTGNITGNVAGNVSAATVDVSSVLTVDATSLNVTNGQTVAFAKSAYVFNGIGGEDDTTNTITIGNVSAAMVGAKITLVVAAASSNLVTIADSAPCYLSAAWVADNTDTLELYVVATNVLVETSRSNN